jgi:hypothetical protein
MECKQYRSTGIKETMECAALSEAAGFRWAFGGATLPCKTCPCPDADDPMAYPAFQQLVKQGLQARLVLGDMPKTGGCATPVEELWRRFRALATPEEFAEHVKTCYKRQAAIAEADGGHPAQTLVAKFVALAEEHDCGEALVEAATEIQRDFETTRTPPSELG